MTVKPTIILIRETWQASLIRDAGTTLSLVALIGIGVVTGSSAMQWVGAIIGFLAVISRTMSQQQKCTFTIEGARKRIDELEVTHGLA